MKNIIPFVATLMIILNLLLTVVEAKVVCPKNGHCYDTSMLDVNAKKQSDAQKKCFSSFFGNIFGCIPTEKKAKSVGEKNMRKSVIPSITAPPPTKRRSR